MREMLYRSLARAILICALGVSGLVGYAQPGAIIPVQTEDFNACALPAGWQANIINGNRNWTFTVIYIGALGGNMNGTCVAAFDDDAAGNTGIPNHAELIGPAVDVTSYATVTLEFDFNTFFLGGDMLRASVWDGAGWVQVFLETSNNPGTIGGQTHASIDVSAYKNANFQVKYEYEDAGVWGWGVGVDNSQILGQIPYQYDAKVSNNLGAMEYTKIPISQTPIDIIATAENIGTDTITNVVISTSITDGVIFLSQASNPQTLAPGETFDFTFPGGFLPPNPGVWSIESQVFIAEPDGNLSNNTTPPYNQEYTDIVYARDDEFSTFAMGIGAGTEGSMGNEYTIKNLSAASGIEIQLGNPNGGPFGNGAIPTTGSEWTVALWDFDSTNGVPGNKIAESVVQTTPSATLGQVIQVDFKTDVLLQPGVYVATMEEPAANPNMAIAKADNIYSGYENKIWFRFPTNPFSIFGGWSHASPFPAQFVGTPMVRLLFSSACLFANAGLDTTVCVDEPVTLGDSLLVAALGVPPYTYSWTPTAGLDDPTLPNPTWTASNNTSSPVTTNFVLTVTDSVGCMATDTVAITVNPKDTVALFLPTTDYCVDDEPDTIDYQFVGGILSGPGVICDTSSASGGGSGGACTPGSIMTITASGNGGNVGGMVYFDFENTTTGNIDITELGMNISGPTTVNIYTISGGSAGNQTNMGAWTLAGTADGSAGPWSGPFPGNGTLTPCPVSGTISLGPGVWGIGLETPTASHNYTNGTGANQTYTTPEVTLQLGTSSNFPFAAPIFDPRVWNGYIDYCFGGSGGGSGGGACAQQDDFQGDYDPANWNFQNVPAGVGGSVNTAGAPASIVITGGNAGVGGSSQYTIAAACDGTVSFDWDYTTVDGPTFDPFGYVKNGVFTELTNPGGPQVQSGSTTFSVANGDVFGFSQNTVDGVFGAGITTISSFNGPIASGGGSGGPVCIFDPAVAGPGTHVLTYCYTNNYGCTYCDSFVVTVHPLPDASITAELPLCVGEDPIFLTAATPLGTWSGPGIIDPLTGEFDPSSAGPGTHTIYYEVLDPNGCFNRDSTEITVHDSPIADAGPDLSTCEGESVVIGGNPTFTPGSDPINGFLDSYSWTPQGSLSSSVDPNPVATPTATTTYIVTVQDNNGCIDRDTMTVSVMEAPVADAGPAVMNSCNGTPVVIGGSPAATLGLPPYTYSWAPATGLSSTTIPNPTASPAVNTVYTLTVTDANGCSDDATVEVRIVNGPVANAGVDIAVCSDVDVTLGGIPTAAGGNPPYSYNWAPATGLSNPNVANPVFNATNFTALPVPYSFTVTVTDQYGCESSDVVDVIVNPAVIVDAGADREICWGKSTTLGGVATATNGVPPYTYTWGPTVGLITPHVSNPVATPTSSTIYTVNIVDDNGCEGDDEVTVIVNPLPIAEAGPDQTICKGTTVQIGGQPTANGGLAPYVYGWSPYIGLSNDNVPNPLAGPSVTETFTLTVTDAKGCVDNDVVTVFVVEGPKAAAGKDKDICLGSSAELGAKPAASNGQAPYNYKWTPGADLDNDTHENPIATPNSVGDHMYILTVWDANNCMDKDSMVLTVNPLPEPEITNIAEDYCVNDPIFTLNGDPSGGIYSGPGVNGSTFNPGGAGIGVHEITYTYTDANGCTNSITYVVEVHGLPIIYAGPDKTVYLGYSTTLDAVSGGNYIYVWDPTIYLDDPNALNPNVVLPLQTTTYTILATDDWGCERSDEVTVFVDQNTPLNPPNTFTPNGDGINDTWVIPLLDFFPTNNVKIYNRWGQLVFEADNYSTGTAWDGGDLPEGTYFYVITVDAQGNRVYKGTVTIVR